MTGGSGDVVNLRRARKARARDEARRTADGNAARFGRTRAEREGEAARAEIEARRLDGHRLDGHRIDGRETDGPEGA